jgi:hypothetical protein
MRASSRQLARRLLFPALQRQPRTTTVSFGQKQLKYQNGAPGL